MPHGTIAQAVKLVATGINAKLTYTYYFADSQPSYQSTLTSLPWSNVPPSNPAHPAPGSTSSYSLTASDYVTRTADSEHAFATSLTAIDRVSGVSFNYLNSPSADIVASFLNVDLYDYSGATSSRILAFAQYPQNSLGAYASDIWILQGGVTDVVTLQMSVQHELLHTMGLVDVTPAGAPPVYTGDEDSGRYTIMSYKPHPDEGRRVTELQLYDVAALQSIYGRDDTANAGANSYTQFSETIAGALTDRIYAIWDGAGTTRSMRRRSLRPR